MTQTLLSGPHTLASSSVTKTMVWVMLALTPATVTGLYLFGWPAINLFVVTCLSALMFEAICVKLMERPVGPTLKDGSALLTAWLLAMSLPPWAPWWVGVLGAFLAIVVGKQVFGGLGQNLFNPAMVARVALLVSFPLQLTMWTTPAPLFSELAPNFVEGLIITFGGLSNLSGFDGYSGATVLGMVKTEFTLGRTFSDILPEGINQGAMLVGSTHGSLGETSAMLLGLGGLALMLCRVISWTIPLSFLGSVAALALLFNFFDPEHYPGADYHLLSGALMLGAFFIATDMVTSPSSRAGQLIFGAGCGVLVYVIRTWGGYPEGVAFAVLIMNGLTPVIDHYVKPRIFGRDRHGEPLKIDGADHHSGGHA